MYAAREEDEGGEAKRGRGCGAMRQQHGISVFRLCWWWECVVEVVVGFVMEVEVIDRDGRGYRDGRGGGGGGMVVVWLWRHGGGVVVAA